MGADEGLLTLVTGAGGFIGRGVVSRLKARGCQVLGVDCGHPGDADDVQHVDIADQRQLEAIFESRAIRRVVHLASVLPTASKIDPQRATQVNIGGSLNVFEMARRFAVERVVYASSISVYGTRGNHAAMESDAIAPSDLYGLAKGYVEMLGEGYQQVHGISFASLRIATVVGPGARATASPWRSQIFEEMQTTKAAVIEIPYAATEVLPLVHVDDVAEMLALLTTADTPSENIYNSPADHVQMSEMKDWIESINPQIQVKLGERVVSGFPGRVDGERFTGEFGLDIRSIKEWLEDSAHRS